MTLDLPISILLSSINRVSQVSLQAVTKIFLFYLVRLIDGSSAQASTSVPYFYST